MSGEIELEKAKEIINPILLEFGAVNKDTSCFFRPSRFSLRGISILESFIDASVELNFDPRETDMREFRNCVKMRLIRAFDELIEMLEKNKNKLEVMT